MTLRRMLGALGTTAAVGIAIAGCCSGSKSGPSTGDGETVTPTERAKPGERAKSPGSDFSLVIDKGEVADAIGKKKPEQPDGAKWVIIRFRLRNDGKEPKSALLEYKELLEDKSGGVYEASTEGSLALTMAEPGSSGSTLDKLAAGAEIKQVAVFAVPADKIGSEVDMVFEQALALLGDPKKLTVTVPLSPHPAGSASVAPATSP